MLQCRAVAILVSCLLCWFPAQMATAQSFLSLERYTPDDGLSQHAVTAMAEDDRGLLWIGTQEGLNRYDGHRFTVLRSAPGDTTGLVSSSIESLAMDASSRLWVGTNDAGLEVIDLRTHRQTRLGVADGLGHPTVRAILIDPAGGAWLGTAAGIARVDGDVTSVRRIGITAAIVALALSADGVAHALDAQCYLWQLDRTSIRLLATLPDGSTCVAMQPADGGFWLATAADGLHRVSSAGRSVGHHSADWLRGSEAELSALLQRSDGQWLLGYADGVVTQAPADWHAAPTPIAFDQKIDSAIARFQEHSSGVLWIGSLTSGLFRARALSSTIRRGLVDADAVAAWPSRSVRSILRDGEKMLVGTDAGLVMRDRSGAAWKSVDAIGPTSVRAIAPAHRGGWWVGTHRGLWHLDPAGNARAIPGLPDPHVTALLVENGVDGEHVWIATRGGLAQLRGDASVDSDGLPPMLAGKFLTSLMRDQRGRLWIGSNESGVFRIEEDGGVQHLGTHNGRLTHDSIWSLHADDTAVWLGSFAGGLLRLDLASDVVRSITDRDGLSNNVIYRIEPDTRGRLWLTTNHGISVLAPASGIVQTLDRSDGLFNHEYNSGASFADADGLLYLGGTDGLDIVDPRHLPATSPPATPMITGLRVLGRQGPAADPPPEPTPEVLYADHVKLGYRDRVFQLDMVAMDFTAPNAARLRYRIDGIHDGWVQPHGAQSNLVLSYLPPGEYPLEVQAAGRDGRFGASRRLMLAVQPPPWRHPLAYTAYALLALAMLAWWQLHLGAQAREKRAQIDRLNLTVAERTAALKQANRLLLSSNEQLELATRIDPLTQVSNRRDLQEWLARECPLFIHEITQSDTPGRCMLFCMIDIDDFKRINDGYGHQVGDEVLVEVAHRLRQVCRERDILVRWGGEEFLLLMRDAHLQDAPGLAERIRRSIADTAVTLGNGHEVPITASIGLAPWPLSIRWPSMGDWEQSVRLADLGLYAAKAAGKNAWVGVLPGPRLDRSNLQSLLAGAVPEQLVPGSVEVLHSTPAPPRFLRD